MSKTLLIKRVVNDLRGIIRVFHSQGAYRKYDLKHAFLRLFSRRVRDDYYWSFYTDHYLEELNDVSKSFTVRLNPGDYAFKENSLRKVLEVPQLHPNHRLLYETVLQLEPKSVLEVGCGRGDHLNNLSILSPDTILLGVDISRRQISLLRNTYPRLNSNVKVFDISQDTTKLRLPNVDMVYTQAVLMHIQEKARYINALRNLFVLFSGVVILMENWNRHNFLKDISDLSSMKNMPWKKLYAYYRESPELNVPHLMVLF